MFQLLGSRIKEQPLSGTCCPRGRGGREPVKSGTSCSFFLNWPTVTSPYISLDKTSHMIMRDVMDRKATYCSFRKALQVMGDGEGRLTLLQGRGEQVSGNTTLSAGHKGTGEIMGRFLIKLTA